MAIVDQKSRPLALFLSSAQPHEITLLKQTLDALKAEKIRIICWLMVRMTQTRWMKISVKSA
jgi:hypothetical protein